VATTVTLGTYEILRSPRMAECLKSELKTAWPDIRQPPSIEALDASTYLTALIKESLRFTPPPGRLGRYNPSEVEHYKNYTSPPGTIFSTSLLMVSRDPSIWGSDAEAFRPER
jgi:cytochrome P450